MPSVLRHAPVHDTQAPPRGPARRTRGFTLIELMIAVAVIGILCAIAYPSFMDPVRKARRLDAVVALFEIQHAQERWRAQCPCYAARLAATTAGCPAAACAPDSGLTLAATSRSGHYALAISDPSPSGYTLTAIAAPGSSQAGDGACATLTVTVRHGHGVLAPPACWSR
jgi:type IV pilus assembly protein PilE